MSELVDDGMMGDDEWCYDCHNATSNCECGHEVVRVIMEALHSMKYDPCAVCGEIGDALPCINCDKLVCGDCGTGERWCGKECMEVSAKLRRAAEQHAPAVEKGK